jgi:Skp family chaperone for outer membrane proteins
MKDLATLESAVEQAERETDQLWNEIERLQSEVKPGAVTEDQNRRFADLMKRHDEAVQRLHASTAALMQAK